MIDQLQHLLLIGEDRELGMQLTNLLKEHTTYHIKVTETKEEGMALLEKGDYKGIIYIDTEIEDNLEDAALHFPYVLRNRGVTIPIFVYTSFLYTDEVFYNLSLGEEFYNDCIDLGQKLFITKIKNNINNPQIQRYIFM